MDSDDEDFAMIATKKALEGESLENHKHKNSPIKENSSTKAVKPPTQSTDTKKKPSAAVSKKSPSKGSDPSATSNKESTSKHVAKHSENKASNKDSKPAQENNKKNTSNNNNSNNKPNEQTSKVSNGKENSKNAKPTRVDDELGSDKSLFEPYSDNELSGTESESEESESSVEPEKKIVKKDDGNKGKRDKANILILIKKCMRIVFLKLLMFFSFFKAF
jgi:hypothetical protein